jgi:catechol 2,3-dioxygenase-like lactoylglutathione lyase family enzyme
MKGIRHAGIVVKDMDKALYFYRDLLGFKTIKEAEGSGDYIDTLCGTRNAQVTMVKLAAGDNNLIELLCFSPSGAGKNDVKGLNTPGFSHIACTVGNIVREYARLKKAGVSFISSPQRSPDGYAKVVFCLDPEGNYIELVEEL